MPLETTVNHIADLEPLYPFGTDNRLQGDNHIRNIKQALKNDIPLTTPATATGITLLTIASPAAARTALGSTATGDALFTTASATAARTTLDVYSTTQAGTATSSAITTALNTPVVAATISASQTITSSTWTKVNFDTVTVNKIGTFSTANKRWTPGVVGTVRISASFGFSTSVAASLVILSIYKNGTVLKRLDEISGTNLQGIANGTAIVETNATDYFEIYAYITATTPTISYILSSAFDGEYIRS